MARKNESTKKRKNAFTLIEEEPLTVAKAPGPERRDYAKEREIALIHTIDRVADIRDDRNTGALGDEVIKMAQALILCTLPYRPTEDRQVLRTARLSDGSILKVTFTAGLTGVPLAFGNDRTLMAWLFDKAINSDTPFVTIKNATEYFRDTGKTRNGKRVKELAERLRRLTGLIIGIERNVAGRTQTVMLPVIAASNLPNNLTITLDAEENGQGSIPGLENRFGIQLEERFFQDIKNHHVAIPRRLWTRLQGQQGSPQLQDFMTFFVYRCYCAQSETVIPWESLRQQFPQDDTNKRRFKQNISKAIRHLRLLWPEAKIDVLQEGVWVNRSTTQLLPDDQSKKRMRRLDVAS